MRSTKRGVFVVVLLVLLFGGAMNVAAEVQVDIGINVPYYVGVRTDDDDIDEAVRWVFVLPDVKVNWFDEVGPVRIGAGGRLWTLILQSVIYPIVSLEADVGRFVLNTNLGGGLFINFGLYTGMHFAGVFLPEFSAAYRMTDTFSLGTGAMFLFAPEVEDLSSFAYMGTVFGRFTIRP